jgi:glycosyltransferase involved in cell wall biosynthesis
VGILGAAVKLVGYRGRVVAVDHGSLLALSSLPPLKRTRLSVARSLARSLRYEHVVVSRVMLEEVQRRRAAGRCTLIYNGVDLPKAYCTPELTPGRPLIIGAAGRVAAGKGLAYAIRALAGQSAVLRIAGDGPDRADLEALARDIGVADRVEFLGWIDDLQGFWRDCHIGVMPSTGPESFGLAAVEAMAAARPVIVSDQDGLVEIVGPSGLVVAAGDAAAIGQAIERLWNAPETIKTLAIEARRRAEQLFDIRKAASAYARLLGIAPTQRPAHEIAGHLPGCTYAIQKTVRP